MHNPGVRWTIRIAALALAVLALHRDVIEPWEANRILWAVQQRSKMAFQSGPDRAARIARFNIDELRPIERTCSTNVDYYLLLAANARIMGDSALAISEYTAALSADHRPEIYFNRGMTYLESGNAEAAMPDFVRAVRFNPNYLDSLDGELRQRIGHEAGIQ